MNIIGKENIEAKVKEIAETLKQEDKEAVLELLYYYHFMNRDIKFLQDSLNKEREIYQKYVISTMKMVY